MPRVNIDGVGTFDIDAPPDQIGDVVDEIVAKFKGGGPAAPPPKPEPTEFQKRAAANKARLMGVPAEEPSVGKEFLSGVGKQLKELPGQVLQTMTAAPPAWERGVEKVTMAAQEEARRGMAGPIGENLAAGIGAAGKLAGGLPTPINLMLAMGGAAVPAPQVHAAVGAAFGAPAATEQATELRGDLGDLQSDDPRVREEAKTRLLTRAAIYGAPMALAARQARKISGPPKPDALTEAVGEGFKEGARAATEEAGALPTPPPDVISRTLRGEEIVQTKPKAPPEPVKAAREAPGVAANQRPEMQPNEIEDFMDWLREQEGPKRDRTDVAGVSGAERVGPEPVEALALEGAGGEAAPHGRMVQEEAGRGAVAEGEAVPVVPALDDFQSMDVHITNIPPEVIAREGLRPGADGNVYLWENGGVDPQGMDDIFRDRAIDRAVAILEKQGVPDAQYQDALEELSSKIHDELVRSSHIYGIRPASEATPPDMAMRAGETAAYPRKGSIPPDEIFRWDEKSGRWEPLTGAAFEKTMAAPEPHPRPAPVAAEGEQVQVTAEKQPWEMTRDDFTAWWADPAKAIREHEAELTELRTALEAAVRQGDAHKASEFRWAVKAHEDALARAKRGDVPLPNQEQLDWQRRGYVEDALKERRAVPPEVLADYPDLAKSAPPVVATPPVEAESAGAAFAGGPMSQPPLGRRLAQTARNVFSPEFLAKMKGLREEKRRIFNRNLQFTEAEAPEAAPLLAKGANPKPASRLMIGTMKRDINRIAKAVGKKWDDFATIMVESQLRGARERYATMAADIYGTDEGTVLTDYREKYRPFLEAMDEMGAGDLKEADGFMAQKDATGLKQSLLNSFNDATQRVGQASNPGLDIDAAMQEPWFKESLRIYKERFEKPMQALHEKNFGKRLEFLGPTETYYPLSRIEPSKAMNFAKRLPFKRPVNPRSHIRTGLAPSYDLSTRALVDATRQMVRSNNIGAAFDSLEKAGLMQRLKPGEPPGDTMLVRGVEEPVRVVDIGVPKLIVKEGEKGQLVPAPRAVIPERLYKELAPILDAHRETMNLLQKINRGITELNLGGPTDAVYHISNQTAAVIFRIPVIALAVLKDVKKRQSLQDVIVSIGKDIADPLREENIPILQGIAEHLAPRFGDIAYTKAGAESVSGRTYFEGVMEAKGWRKLPASLHVFSPLIYGPHGMDVRVRLIYAKVAQILEPGISWGDQTKWMSELGNYNPGLAAGIERSAKRSGLAPFATAGRAFNKLARQLLYGAPENVPGGLDAKAAAIAGSAVTPLALWVTLYYLYHGRPPWEDKKSVPMRIPLKPEDRTGPLAEFMGLDDPKTSVDLSLVWPLVNRGLRSVGALSAYKGAVAGRPREETLDAMVREALNTRLHPYTGPPVRIGTRLIAGSEPYISAAPAYQGGGWRLMSSTPQGTRPEDRILENFKAAAAGLNPITEQLYHAEKPWEQLATDTLAPRLVARPMKVKKAHR